MSLILGTLVGLAGGYALYTDFRKDSIEINRQKKELKKKFNMVLDGSNKSIKNKMEQKFEILKYFPMHYGFDLIISIPYGLTLENFHNVIPQLESALNANIIAELSSKKTTIYSRVHFRKREIDDKYSSRIIWYQLMYHNTDYRNKNHETFMIKELTEERYGFKMKVNVPTGLDYSTILNNMKVITNAYKCNVWGEYNRENSEILMTIIKHEIPDDYKFVPVKVKPNEFCIGMKYDYSYVIVNMEDYPHGMYSGMTRMGKTVAVLIAISNLVYWCNPSEVEFFFCQLSSKQDLNIFRNIKHCKYYANTVDKLLSMLKYLDRIQEYRNNIMFNQEDYIENIYKWNKKFPNKKFSEIYYIGDEASMLQPVASDSEEIQDKKKICLAILTKLYQQGASAGIHVINSLQRPSRDSFNAPMKAQIGLKICFRQPNNASSLTVLDDNTATELRKREAIVEFDGRYLMKTPYLDTELINEYISKWNSDKPNHLILDDNGNIIPENMQVVKEDEEIEQDEIENVPNVIPKLIEIPFTRKEKRLNRSKKYLENKILIEEFDIDQQEDYELED